MERKFLYYGVLLGILASCITFVYEVVYLIGGIAQMFAPKDGEPSVAILLTAIAMFVVALFCLILNSLILECWDDDAKYKERFKMIIATIVFNFVCIALWWYVFPLYLVANGLIIYEIFDKNSIKKISLNKNNETKTLKNDEISNNNVKNDENCDTTTSILNDANVSIADSKVNDNIDNDTKN